MLPQYQRILYATDLSENAKAAFRHAVSFAKTYQAKIFLLHVIPARLFDKREKGLTSLGYASSMLGDDLNGPQMEQSKGEIVQKIHDRIKSFAKEELGTSAEEPDWIGGIEVVAGQNPVSEIFKACERLDIDLMVFGSHSKGFIKQTLLGSVAEAVLEELTRPALIVPIP